MTSGSAGRVEGGWMLWKRKWRDRCGGFGASGRGDRSWGRFPGPGVRCLRSRPTFGGLATTTRSRYELTMSSPLRGLPRVGFGSMGWGRGRARPGVSRADGCSGSASARPLRRAWPFWSGKSFVGTISPTRRAVFAFSTDVRSSGDHNSVEIRAREAEPVDRRTLPCVTGPSGGRGYLPSRWDRGRARLGRCG